MIWLCIEEIKKMAIKIQTKTKIILFLNARLYQLVVLESAKAGGGI
jgi:hypothetical protein